MTASSNERSVDQVAHESAMAEVAETLLNIEQAQHRADRDVKAVALLGRDRNTELALRAAAKALADAHKALFEEAYLSGAQQRLV